MFVSSDELDKWCESIKDTGVTIESAFATDNEAYICMKPESFLKRRFEHNGYAKCWLMTLMPKELFTRILNKEVELSCGEISFNSVVGSKSTIGYIANLRG